MKTQIQWARVDNVYRGSVGIQEFTIEYDHDKYRWVLKRMVGARDYVGAWASRVTLGRSPRPSIGQYIDPVELKELAEQHVLPSVQTVAQCDHTGLEIKCLKVDGRLYTMQGQPLPENWIEEPEGSWGALLLVFVAFILTVGVGYGLSVAATL